MFLVSFYCYWLYVNCVNHFNRKKYTINLFRFGEEEKDWCVVTVHCFLHHGAWFWNIKNRLKDWFQLHYISYCIFLDKCYLYHCFIYFTSTFHIRLLKNNSLFLKLHLYFFKVWVWLSGFRCPPPHLMVFFEPPPIKTHAPPIGTPHLKMKPPPPPQLKNNPPYWKMKPPSRKWFLEKNIQKIRNCHLPKIPQIHNFLSWSIQNFIRKWNSLLEIIITWLTWLTN